MRVLATAIAGLTLLSVSHTGAAPNQARGVEAAVASAAVATDFSAAKRRKKQVRANADEEFLATRSMTNQAERAQIACPRTGCQPVPRGCLREPERTLGGEPTGFDRIVCPMR